MATYRDSTSMSTNRLTLLLVGHSFVHFRAVCNSKCAGTLLCCCSLQTLLHCCGNTNIAVLLYLLDLTHIDALLWNYKHCCVAVSAGLYKHCCTAVELQTLLCCCTCWSLQTLLHCCGITNIAVPAIIAILYICRTLRTLLHCACMDL